MGITPTEGLAFPDPKPQGASERPRQSRTDRTELRANAFCEDHRDVYHAMRRVIAAERERCAKALCDGCRRGLQPERGTGCWVHYKDAMGDKIEVVCGASAIR